MAIMTKTSVWDDFLGEVAEDSKSATRKGCSVQKFLDSLDPEGRSAVETALANESISSIAILRALQKS
jgi:hypothetical protein